MKEGYDLEGVIAQPGEPLKWHTTVHDMMLDDDGAQPGPSEQQPAEVEMGGAAAPKQKQPAAGGAGTGTPCMCHALCMDVHGAACSKSLQRLSVAWFESVAGIRPTLYVHHMAHPRARPSHCTWHTPANQLTLWHASSRLMPCALQQWTLGKVPSAKKPKAQPQPFQVRHATFADNHDCTGLTRTRATAEAETWARVPSTRTMLPCRQCAPNNAHVNVH